MIKILSDFKTIFLSNKIIHDISVIHNYNNIELTVSNRISTHTIRIEIKSEKIEKIIEERKYYLDKIDEFAHKVNSGLADILLDLRSGLNEKK